MRACVLSHSELWRGQFALRNQDFPFHLSCEPNPKLVPLGLLLRKEQEEEKALRNPIIELLYCLYFVLRLHSYPLHYLFLHTPCMFTQK